MSPARNIKGDESLMNHCLSFPLKEWERKTKNDKVQKGTEKISRNNNKTCNKMALNTYFSIITLNVNGINVPVKRYRVTE